MLSYSILYSRLCLLVRAVYGKEMEKDVVDDTSGHFRRLLVAQIQGGRDESKTFDRTAAQDDAQSLFKAGEGKWGTDESMCALNFLNFVHCLQYFLIF